MRYVLFILVVLASTSALAEMRCATNLVERGATPFEVRERCGAPVSEFSFVDYRYPGYTVYVDEWLYDLGRNRFTTLRKRDGLPNDYIYSILEDEEDRLWLATGRGLVCYDPENGEMRIFDSYDGLTPQQFG